MQAIHIICMADKEFSTPDVVVTTLYMGVVLVYLATFMYNIIVPSILTERRLLKGALLSFSIFGLFALVFKYVLEYSIYISLVFLILYSAAYLLGLQHYTRIKKRLNAHSPPSSTPHANTPQQIEMKMD